MMQLATNTTLPASTEPLSLVQLRLSAPLGGACSTCTITMEDGQTGPGSPVTNVVSAGGYAYLPKLEAFSFEICPE